MKKRKTKMIRKVPGKKGVYFVSPAFKKKYPRAWALLRRTM